MKVHRRKILYIARMYAFYITDLLLYKKCKDV